MLSPLSLNTHCVHLHSSSFWNRSLSISLWKKPPLIFSRKSFVETSLSSLPPCLHSQSLGQPELRKPRQQIRVLELYLHCHHHWHHWPCWHPRLLHVEEVSDGVVRQIQLLLQPPTSSLLAIYKLLARVDMFTVEGDINDYALFDITPFTPHYASHSHGRKECCHQGKMKSPAIGNSVLANGGSDDTDSTNISFLFLSNFTHWLCFFIYFNDV